MGLSRNKVAVPEGAAGTPPFWRDALEEEILEALESLENLEDLEALENLEKIDLGRGKRPRCLALLSACFVVIRYIVRKVTLRSPPRSGQAARSLLPSRASPIAQLVRAPH